MSEPPRDEHGNVVPHDHAEIRDDDGVIRRIHPHYIVQDPKVGGKKISSMAIQKSTGPGGGMSVDLLREIVEAGLDPREFVISPPFLGAIKFTAGAFRRVDLMVGFDPLPPENPYHGEVWGEFTKPKQRQLLGVAEWFVPLEGIALGTA